jgi:thiosulfate dehydrogenase
MKIFTSFIVSLSLATTLTLAYGIGQEEQASAKNKNKDAIKRGAQMYDNWIKLADYQPVGNNPLYPPAGKASGESTWLCAECHGWDYIGKNGSYRSGDHYTGIEGIFAASQKDETALKNILSDNASQHDFKPYLDAEQLDALILFIKKGLFETASVIDANGRAKGNAKQGAAMFAKNCVSCHGKDGNGYDFEYKQKGIQGIGWLANENPQKALHKIRWGNPGTYMPSLLFDAKLEDNDAVDILTYAQTLK